MIHREKSGFSKTRRILMNALRPAPATMRLPFFIAALPAACRAVLLPVFMTALLPMFCFAQCQYLTPVTPETCQAAATYNGQQGGVSLLVWVDGQLVCEDYKGSGGPYVPHEIWSGTKSFWGVIAAAALQDGLILSLDERASNAITEWQGDAWKSLITVRHLLKLISGLQVNLSGTSCPPYADAIQAPALHEPGTYWEYGPVPYQSFGEFIRRKIVPTYYDPLEYLEARILNRIGAQYSGWTYGTDGYPQLPQGSQWTAREWIKYGELVRLGGFWPPTGDQVVEQVLMDECFHRSSVKNDYGMTWWLPVSGNPDIPCDAVMARGLGTQNLYVIRSLKLVAVRQTAYPWSGLQFSDATFLDMLLVNDNAQDDCPPAEVQDLFVTRLGSDLRFTWQPVNHDITGNTDLLRGYDLWRATEPDFSNGTLHMSTTGPVPALIAPGEASSLDDIVFYQVRATDKCGNTSPF